MENSYLFAVICCLLPFVIGGIWFAVHDNNPECQTKPEMIQTPVVQGAEDVMLREYYYGIGKLFSPSNYLLKELEKVNVYDPRNRCADYMDEWFKNATPKLMHDGVCLAYINNHGHLEDAFWKNIEMCGLNPEQDKKFQQLLISVYKTSWGIWLRNYSNLLFSYGMRYKLLPEIEDILNTDARFGDSKQSYNFARHCAEKENLKTL